LCERIVFRRSRRDNQRKFKLTFRKILEMDRIDAMRLLLDVAQAGSFSGVGRQRAIATSTVTLAVSQLEQEFGATLITRSTRRLVFTHAGETLLADARRIVS
jgi:DNA-binding transcriptional LysR family regulator